ncbi:unnamed protein product [Soboliphyme baturini]|uniref:ADP-dependent glucokinase n=1 Tax=Soboliphyme baturini TaxID=241478 RepID=A0A183IRG5_9BILA|nr:unnamed protein product [Soboliphyme baturini]
MKVNEDRHFKVHQLSFPFYLTFFFRINSNVDLIVSGTQLWTRMNVMSGSVEDHRELQTLDEVQQVFSMCFSRGIAIERYVANGEVFQELVNAAENKLSTFQVTVGGNAALFAQQIAMEHSDAEVLLVGPVGPKLKSLLLTNVLTQNSTKIAMDEIHLIMEFKQGEIWGDYIAPTNSRLIISHDQFSSSAVIIDMFFNNILLFRPDLIILTGIHLLEFNPKELWMEKLIVIKRKLNQASKEVPIHLELGHLSDPEFTLNVLHKIIPYVDSLGLGEQQLAALSKAAHGPFADQIPASASTIHVYKATEILHWLLRSSTVESKRRYFRLQRIHLRCLTYHMIASRGPNWSNGAAALVAGAMVYAQRACGFEGGTLSDLVELRVSEEHLVDQRDDRKYKFKADSPLMSWMREDVLFIYTPVLLCKHPVKTVGISHAGAATSLMYSQFFRIEK